MCCVISIWHDSTHVSCKGHDTTQHKKTQKKFQKKYFFSSKIVQKFLPNNFKKFQKKYFFFKNFFKIFSKFFFQKIKNIYYSILCLFVLCCVVSCHMVLCRVVWCCVVSYRLDSLVKNLAKTSYFWGVTYLQKINKPRGKTNSNILKFYLIL